MAKNSRGKRSRQRFASAVSAWFGVALLAVGMVILLSRPVWIQTLIALERKRLPVDRVVVDAGHGGTDPGASSHGLLEKEVTRDIALRLATVLKRKKIPTTLTRRGDYAVSLKQRAKIANAYANPLFVSIHCNHANRAQASGIETYFYYGKAAPLRRWFFVRLSEAHPDLANGAGWATSEKLANSIQEHLVAATKANNRGVKERKLAVLRMTRGASVLVEVGFLSNKTEAELLGTSQHRALLAEAIGEGISQYLSTLRQNLFPIAEDANEEVEGASEPGAIGG